MSKLSTNSLKAVQKPRKCPKCGKEFTDYPAFFREDNETEICPEYGVREALQSYMNFRVTKTKSKVKLKSFMVNEGTARVHHEAISKLRRFGGPHCAFTYTTGC